MSGCYGSDPEDKYFEQLLFKFLEEEAWQEDDELMDDWEEEYYKENCLTLDGEEDEQV
jgi:hypothetical protein